VFAPYVIGQRQIQQPQPVSVAGKSIPAPTGGLNARDAIANMPETDCVICDNFLPTPSNVQLRKGRLTLATFSGNCETLAAYPGLIASELFAAVNNSGVRSIFRVDNLAGGPVGAAVVGGSGGTIQAITSTQYDWVMSSTGAVEALYLVNGVDNPLLFDGTTWYSVSQVSVPYALTGINPNTLSAVGSYHGSLFFIQANSFNVWWLPVNALAGALTQLPLGAYFGLGGQLVSIVTVSIDNSNGVQDYIAFVSSVGEVVVFQGYNPASTTTWFLSAHFRIGRPIGFGRRCWQKMGSDAAIICVDGVIMLSEALLTDRSQTRSAITDKIRNAINADILSYGLNFGWQAQLYPAGNKLLINVPTTQESASYQYVMSTLNGSWCTYGKYASPWNAYCFEVLGDNLFFGTTGSVQQCDTGQDDAGASIQGLCTPAFSYFGMPGRLKRWTMARPIFTTNGSLSVGLTLNVDFATGVPTGTVPVTVGNAAPWNTSPWNTTLWGDATRISKQWIGIPGLGYAGSLSLQVNAKDVTIQWQSTDYQFEPGGLM
jgi:hypothetical protein